MSHQVVIHGFAPSTWTRTARIACLEKGVDHRLEPVDYGADSHARLHPFRRVPAATIDGAVIYETLAIVSYVDAVVDGPALIPANPLERARALGWVTAGVNYLYPDLVRALLADDRPDDAAETIAGHLAVVEGALADREHLAGPDPSVADFAIAPMLDFAAALVDLGDALARLPRVSSWQAGLNARPSFIATAATIPA